MDKIYPIPKETYVVILCGGLGTRLKKITADIPKPMIKIGKSPFLDIIINYMSDFGFKHFILCIGYKGGAIKKYYQNNKKQGTRILFSSEREPLDTGGAVKKARTLIKSDPFIVLNGDSFSRFNPIDLLRVHKKKKALISMVLTKSHKIRPDVGSVNINYKDKITRFSEKNSFFNNGYINVGSYIFNKKIFSYMPDKMRFSLEYDLFPRLINKGICGYTVDTGFIDIGTPRRLREAKRFFIRGFKR